ncbi:MAG: polysaccharide biosynthesis C-terminal domain-containing protein [Bacteroidetes bacterium]|nr:polysaccharide biosynthesis C-terminal domain-containing protein [Bacteroidota bacterium]
MFQNIGSLIVKFSGALISYLLTIYLSRYFGNEWLGYFSFLLSYSLIFILVMKWGTDVFLMKNTSQYIAEGAFGKAKFLYYRLLGYHLVSGGIITLLGVFITPIMLHYFFPRYEQVQFFRISLVSIFFINLYIMNYEFLRGRQQVLTYTFYHTVAIFFFTLLFLYLQHLLAIAFENQIAWSYLLATVISFLLSMMHVIRINKNIDLDPIPAFRLSEALRKSFPFFSNNAVFVLLGTLDVFILSKYVSPAQIGEYTLMVKIAAFVSFPLLVLSANFAPKIAALASNRSLQQRINKMTGLITMAAISLFLIIYFSIGFFQQFLHISQPDTLKIFIIIALGYVVSSSCALNEVCLLMLGQEKLYQKIMIISLILNFLLNLLLIPILKETGAAITHFVTLVFWNLLSVYFVHKKLNLNTALILQYDRQREQRN